MKAILRTVTIASFLLIVFSGADTPAAHAGGGGGCGDLNQDCCVSGPECDRFDLVCSGSTCVECGGLDQPCCDSQVCDQDLECQTSMEDSLQGDLEGRGGGAGSTTETCVPVCGGENEPCCIVGDACDANLICGGFDCIPCGGVGEPCCTGLSCDLGLSCETPQFDTVHEEASGGGATLGPEICIDCGDTGEPCCGGTDCNAGAFCSVGTCESCGGDGEPCCEAEMCDTGFICGPLCQAETLDEGRGSGAGDPCEAEQLQGVGGGASAVHVCQPCGGADQPCCEEMSCNEGFLCQSSSGESPGEGGAAGFVNGSCIACGALGEPCCDDSTCDGDNLLCGGEFCEACGVIGEQCCEESTCPNAAAVCLDDICNPLPAAPAMGAWGIVALLLMLTGVGAFRLSRQ